MLANFCLHMSWIIYIAHATSLKEVTVVSQSVHEACKNLHGNKTPKTVEWNTSLLPWRGEQRESLTAKGTCTTFAMSLWHDYTSWQVSLQQDESPGWLQAHCCAHTDEATWHCILQHIWLRQQRDDAWVDGNPLCTYSECEKPKGHKCANLSRRMQSPDRSQLLPRQASWALPILLGWQMRSAPCRLLWLRFYIWHSVRHLRTSLQLDLFDKILPDFHMSLLRLPSCSFQLKIPQA